MKSNALAHVLALCSEFDATPVDVQSTDASVLDIAVTMSDSRRVTCKIVGRRQPPGVSLDADAELLRAACAWTEPRNRS